MTPRRRLLLGLGGGLTAALILAWSFWGAGSALFARERQDGWNYHPGRLAPGESVGQTFICRLTELTRVDLKLGTYGRPRPGDLKLELIEVKQPKPALRARPMAAGDGGLPVLLGPGGAAVQSFRAGLNNLAGVRILMDGRPLSPQARLQLELLDSTNRVAAAAQLPAARAARSGLILFAWPPIPDSAGRDYRFRLTVTGDKASGPTVLRFAPQSGGDVYPAGRALAGGPGGQPGDFIFRPAYPPTMADKPVIRRAIRSGWWLTDNSFNSFTFKPIETSLRRNYYARFTQLGAPGVTALADTADRYGYGSLVLDGVPSVGGLAFRAYGRIDRTEAVGMILAGATKNRPWPWNRPGLIVGLAAVQIILLGLMIGWLLTRRPTE